MEIKLDDEVILKLSEIELKTLMNDISSDELKSDIARRLKYIIMHKHAECLKRLKKEWMPKFKELGKDSIPVDDNKFCEEVFACESYECKKKRMLKNQE